MAKKWVPPEQRHVPGVPRRRQSKMSNNQVRFKTSSTQPSAGAHQNSYTATEESQRIDTLADSDESSRLTKMSLFKRNASKDANQIKVVQET